MRKAELNKWNAKAEMCAMGFTIPVNSPEEAKYIIGHLVYLINELQEDENLVNEIYEGAMKYNSENEPITHIQIQKYGGIGTLLTLVRDNEMRYLTQPEGVLAYVYNFNYPDCSELGYVFFQNVDGGVTRIA